MTFAKLTRPLRLLLIAPPGGGKGTISSKLLKQHPEITSLSSGDLLRQEIKNQTSIGSQATSLMQSGKLLPDQLVSDLVIKELKTQNLLQGEKSWLLDGFPRTLAQAQILDSDLYKESSQINMVIELKVPHSVILDRIENRWVHIPSGRIYNLTYSPPKVPGLDDVTGEPLSKRPDDNVEVFKQRLEQYEKTVGPLREFYGKQGVLNYIAGDSSDIIFPKVQKLIEECFGPDGKY
ncbi:hypothetical protein WICPIJ_000869 [Wickerhamomyces pijperi]|uniref:GTP:AMP phosphotransferase, mitochondrial n=1 Tax=Wickerhamomyces pijperi TaxID=599730 RepID=A0A9P8TRZ7_WICPI|nr:hypothetical protein WICPIJ_000869 [Wickerhamomyces pijperi]